MSARIRNHVAYLEARLKRPEHKGQADYIKSEITRYKGILEEPQRPDNPEPSHRLMYRVETLVRAIRKGQAILEAEPKHPKAKGIIQRIGEYQQSIRNIQEYGREKKPTNNPEGALIEVPMDVLGEEDYAPVGAK